MRTRDPAARAGAVTVAADLLELRAGGAIRSNTFVTGNAGTVMVEAERLSIDGTGSAFLTGISSEASAGSGDGGTIAVSAGELDMRDGATIRSTTFARGDGGTVRVEAGRPSIAGTGSGLSTSISSEALEGSMGDAGRVTIAADRLDVRDGGAIFSNTFAEGEAGTVVVEAGRLSIDGAGSEFFTGISSEASAGSAGDAGAVVVSAQALDVRNGGAIRSDTFAGGDAGTIMVEAADLLLDGAGSRFFTGTSSDANPDSTGNARAVEVIAGRLELRDAGTIGSSGLGTGRAGDVLVVADQLAAGNGQIQTRGSAAEGGLITVRAAEHINLVGSEVTSSGILPGEGDSIITMRAPTIVFNNSRAESLTGVGEPLAGSGVVQVLGELTVISSDSEVAASSSVEVSGLESDVTAGIEVLPGAFLDVSGQLRTSCAARRAERVSSFVQTGQRTLVPEIDGPLPGRYAELSDIQMLAPAPAANGRACQNQ